MYQPCQHFSSPRHEVPSRVGYIRVDTYLSGPSTPEEYAQRLQDQIRLSDQSGVIGWIVDLRENRGGDMWPMILGVGPLLTLGTVGYFTYPDGSQLGWGYSSGVVTMGWQRRIELTEAYSLTQGTGTARVAVVTSRATVSAGEAVAIAFRGQANVRSFGEPTCGRSTSNRAFELNDGAWLFLTTSTMTDRNQTHYGGPVVPHEVIPAGNALKRAIEWLGTPQA